MARTPDNQSVSLIFLGGFFLLFGLFFFAAVHTDWNWQGNILLGSFCMAAAIASWCHRHLVANLKIIRGYPVLYFLMMVLEVAMGAVMFLSHTNAHPDSLLSRLVGGLLIANGAVFLAAYFPQ